MPVYRNPREAARILTPLFEAQEKEEKEWTPLENWDAPERTEGCIPTDMIEIKELAQRLDQLRAAKTVNIERINKIDEGFRGVLSNADREALERERDQRIAYDTVLAREEGKVGTIWKALYKRCTLET